jgi:hypothetical protein
MLRSGIPRRLIALVAAYGLVLQAMLAAVAAVASPLDQVICAADTDPRSASDTPHPSLPGQLPGHEPGCPLCPLACGGALGLPHLDATVAPPLGFGIAMAMPAAASLVVPIVRRAGLARAPPA